MTRIIIASVLALGVSGAAVAQEAPVHFGDYSASVAQELNHVAVTPRQGVANVARVGIDYGTTASIGHAASADVAIPQGDLSIPLENSR